MQEDRVLQSRLLAFLNLIFTCVIYSWLSSWALPVYAEDIEYRFERMVPELEQPWYFNAPGCIAIAPDGSIWVADTGNDRIQHLSASGVVLGVFGSSESAPGQFFSPSGISVAADGSVWVVELGNHRIQHLSARGDTLDMFGSNGTGAGQFNRPGGISIAADGSIWVADTGNDRIQHLSASGVVLGVFGSSESAPGQFFSPSGISVAADGSVWVVELGNHRIQHLSASGVVLGQFGSIGRFEAGEFYDPLGISVATDGSVWVADTGNSRIQHLSATGVVMGVFGSSGSAPGQFRTPGGISIAADGSVWVADTGNYRIQHLSATGVVLGVFGSSGSAPGQFRTPGGISIAADGSVWVADTGNYRIQHLSVGGEVLGQFGTPYEGGGAYYPSGISIAADGSVWVAEYGNDHLLHLSASGTVLGVFGSGGSAAGQFDSPGGISVAADGSVWVADSSNNRIQHLSSTGAVIGVFGSKGPAAGQFSYPSGISTAADGSVWVADSGNARIQHLSASGSVLGVFGRKGPGAGQFFSPNGISVAADGSVWVVDTYNNRIQHLSISGSVLGVFGSGGFAAGQFFSPGDISIAADGSVWVADTDNHRIQKFVPRIKIAPHHYKAIILAGGGPKIGGRDNVIWDGTWRVAEKAYRALNRQGFVVQDEIGFLTAGDTSLNLDNNPQSVDLYPANKQNLRFAITEWAADAQDVVIYLADHGGPGRLQVNGTEILTAQELNIWVNALQQKITGKVTVIIEACNSGSFIETLAKQPKRYVLTSARKDQAAVVANDGLNSFSYTLWSEVATGATLQKAFKTARQAMSATQIDGQAIDAQTDNNNDGLFTGQPDYDALGTYCLGNCNIVTASAPPVIQPLAPKQRSLNNSSSLDLSIKVDHLQPLAEVFALVQRPDDPTSDTSIPLNFDKIILACNVQDQCTGRYSKFDTQGDYRLQFYALDNNQEVSLAETLVVTQPQGKAPPNRAYPVTYDEVSHIVHLKDVVAAGQHYQADLNLHNGLFVLDTASVKAITSTQASAANFNASTGFLSIPLARAFGQDYLAIFKHQGNYAFSVESAAAR